jgi:hypothetical protein
MPAPACRRVRRRSSSWRRCWVLGALGGRPRQAWPESRMQDPGPCGAAEFACRDCRPIVATAWQLIGQKGCRSGAGNTAASPSRHRCFGKRAQRRPSTGSPGASAVSVRKYTQYTGIGDTVVIQGLPHDSLIVIYLVLLHEAFQDLRASSDKVGRPWVRYCYKAAVFHLLAQTRGQHPEF